VKSFDLIFLGRPMLLIPVWTIYLHYLSITAKPDFPAFWPGRLSLIQLMALTLISMGVYVLNQIFDIESDRINDKLFFLPRGIINLPTAWIYYAFLTVSGLAAVILLCPSAIQQALSIIALGIFYCVPKIRLKDSPFGGLIANAVAYGFLIPWMVSSKSPQVLPGISMIPYFMAIATGYILTTIPDYEGDAAAGKRTMAVILGRRGALTLALMTGLMTAGFSHMLGNTEMLIVAIVTLVLVVYLLVSFNSRVLMFACKFPILLLTLWAGYHYLSYLVLLLLTIILTRFYYKKRFGMVYPKLS